MKIIKRILLLTLLLFLLLLTFLAFRFGLDGSNPYDNKVALEKVPNFEKIKLNFTHKFNGEHSLPVTASALIDIDNDGVDELFLGGGYDQQDELFRYEKGAFVSIAKAVNLPLKSNLTSLASASVDFDQNGFTDLIVSREDGVTVYYNSNGKFTAQKIDYKLAPNATPMGLTFGDVNKDGFIDIFISHYIRKDQMEGQNNFSKDYGPVSLLLLNNGDNTFKDVTIAAGLEYTHNTFMGILIDIDGDGWLDLIVAHDTGEVRSYRNKGDGTFEMKENPTTNKYSYPMGIAVGDYNNDGRVDFMFSNTGSTVPHFLASGNIEDKTLFNSNWLFFENKGNFEFEDVAQKTKTKDYEFSWGAVFADLNNDGLQELIVAENYVSFPPHNVFRLPGRVLVQKEDHTFVTVEEQAGIANPHYGITPLVSDFNQDGYLDMVWVNIASPVFAFMNKGGANNYIQVALEDQVKSLGAKVQVTTTSGKTITEDYIIGEGLNSDQTNLLHFGLGQEKATKLTVQFISGERQEIDNPTINTLIKIPATIVQDSLEVPVVQ
ncbi:MAG: CRTAC1 family protein [Aureispira sp.]